MIKNHQKIQNKKHMWKRNENPTAHVTRISPGTGGHTLAGGDDAGKVLVGEVQERHLHELSGQVHQPWAMAGGRRLPPERGRRRVLAFFKSTRGARLRPRVGGPQEEGGTKK